MATKDKNVICSFCGKTSQEAERIVLGPGVNICNECIELCSSLLEEDGIIQTKSNLPKKCMGHYFPSTQAHAFPSSGSLAIARARMQKRKLLAVLQS